MKRRHDALIALSHHHHHALVVALKLKKAGDLASESKSSVEETLQTTLDFWEKGGRAHFREEEDILLPAFARVTSVDLPEIKQMLIDHVVIRASMDALKEAKDPLSLMGELGERLQRHVRLEERVIFPMIEKALSEDTLNTMTKEFHVNFHEQN